MKTGIELIAEERKRQIEVEGWNSIHDMQHDGQELALAAAAYALPQTYDGFEFKTDGEPMGYDRLDIFPFERKWWKPSPDDRIRELVKAGALIAAEIDRLNV